MGVLEICAVVLALIYVILAIFQRRVCWIAAIASASLYIVIFWQVQLYLEAALQVFYIAMAVYGWFAWQQKDDESQTPIRKWSPKQHAMACSTLVFLSVLIGSAMARWTDAASPFVDAPLPCLPCLPPGWWRASYWRTGCIGLRSISHRSACICHGISR